jgi:hypothetical protein
MATETKCAIVRALLKQFLHIAAFCVPHIVMKSAILRESADAKSVTSIGWTPRIYWARPKCAIARKQHAYQWHNSQDHLAMAQDGSKGGTCF